MGSRDLGVGHGPPLRHGSRKRTAARICSYGPDSPGCFCGTSTKCIRVSLPVPPPVKYAGLVNGTGLHAIWYFSECISSSCTEIEDKRERLTFQLPLIEGSLAH